jgi:hypothetical protein
MPKLYKTKKIDRGLKIGLREPEGPEWFVDITLDSNKRTCRKIGVSYEPDNEKNVLEAERKAVSIYETLRKEYEFEKSNKISMPGWQLKFFTISLLLLWLTGILWFVLDGFSLSLLTQTQILVFHGTLVIPALISLGILIVSHMPKGWKPERKKMSGISLSAIMFFLVLSGFLLFYLEANAKQTISLSHSLIGFILVPLIFWHYKKRSTN